MSKKEPIMENPFYAEIMHKIETLIHKSFLEDHRLM